jgi:hypothetical protein
MEAVDDSGFIEGPGGCGTQRLGPQHEISNQELYEICSLRLNDVENLLAVLLKWVDDHPDKIERNI